MVFQVVFTSLVKVVSRWILVAVILSIVSLSFIALVHLALISWSVCCTLFLCITRLHLSTQIKWLASDIRICRSLVRPFVFVDATVRSLFCCLPFLGRDICLTPNMVPIVDILTPGYTCTTRIGKGVLEVGAPVRRMGLWTPVGYFLCFQTYCGPGYGWIGLHRVRNPTAILVLLVLILIRCAER